MKVPFGSVVGMVLAALVLAGCKGVPARGERDSVGQAESTRDPERKDEGFHRAGPGH